MTQCLWLPAANRAQRNVLHCFSLQADPSSWKQCQVWHFLLRSVPLSIQYRSHPGNAMTSYP
jgi:hypothetical protein